MNDVRRGMEEAFRRRREEEEQILGPRRKLRELEGKVRHTDAVGPIYRGDDMEAVFRQVHIQREAAEAPSAMRVAEQLRWQLKTFQDGLGDGFDLGVQLTNAGTGVAIRVEDLFYHQPNLLVWMGVRADDPVCVVHHVSQTSVLLVGLPRPDRASPRRPIGFHGFDAPSP